LSGPDIEKKKRRRRRSARVYLSNAHPLPTPEQLRALVDQFPGDEDDGPGSAQKGTMGNVPPGYDRSLSDARVSPSPLAGQAARSTGDHGDPMAVPGPREIAWRHQDLRQSSVSFNDVIARLRTVAGDNAYGDRNVTYTAGQVGLSMFNAAGQAGSYPGMQRVDPMPNRPDYHQSRGSATGPNGTHHASGFVESSAVVNKSNSERLADFKRALFPGHGAR
jgi:hypothetical protein